MRLYKRKNGLYYVELSRGKRRSLGTTDPVTAKKVFKKLEEEILKGRLIKLEAESSITISEFTKEYLEYRQKRVAKDTYKADGLALRKLLEHIGNKPLHMISQKALDEFHTALLCQGAAETSVNVHIRHLKAAFTQAIEWEYLKKSPYRKIKQIKVPDRQPRYLKGEEEFRKLFDAIEDPEFAVMVFWYLYTGCRRSELIRLKWEDVLDEIILIREAKGKRPRPVPIHPDLRDVIDAMERTSSAYVFPRWTNGSTITHLFEEARDIAGLDIRLHDLRHTTASYLAMGGVGQKQVGEILGHEQLTTTEIYTHLSVDHLKSAIEKLDFVTKLHPGNVIALDNKRKK